VGASNGRSGLFGQASARPSHPAIKYATFPFGGIFSGRQPENGDPFQISPTAIRRLRLIAVGEVISLFVS